LERLFGFQQTISIQEQASQMVLIQMSAMRQSHELRRMRHVTGGRDFNRFRVSGQTLPPPLRQDLPLNIVWNECVGFLKRLWDRLSKILQINTRVLRRSLDLQRDYQRKEMTSDVQWTEPDMYQRKIEVAH
jgi:hypothetical protein